MMARTQRLNICEALNYALAGHKVEPYNKEKVLWMKYVDGRLKIKMQSTLEHPKRTERLVNGDDWVYLKELQWHAGDNKTIKGYF